MAPPTCISGLVSFGAHGTFHIARGEHATFQQTYRNEFAAKAAHNWSGGGWLQSGRMCAGVEEMGVWGGSHRRCAWICSGRPGRWWSRGPRGTPSSPPGGPGAHPSKPRLPPGSRPRGAPRRRLRTFPDDSIAMAMKVRWVFLLATVHIFTRSAARVSSHWVGTSSQLITAIRARNDASIIDSR